MKLSGHSFTNDTFASLVDNLKDDIILKSKEPMVKEAQVLPTGTDVFSSTTEDNLTEIQIEGLEQIAGELRFAADKAKIDISASDVAAFAKTAQNMKGKELERAAQRYCSDLARTTGALPSPISCRGDDFINQLDGHKVVPAGFPSDGDGPNDSATGKYIGSLKNPNSIWDSEALTAMASKPMGDEQIKASLQKKAERQVEFKAAMWKDLQEQHSDPIQVHKGITNAGTSNEDAVVNQNLPKNAMSIFSDQREFENIEEKTAGENLAAHATKRAEKRAQAKGEWNHVKAPTTARSGIDRLFEGLSIGD